MKYFFENVCVQAIHNIVAHPLMEILSWFGLKELGIKFHDSTIPKEWR